VKRDSDRVGRRSPLSLLASITTLRTAIAIAGLLTLIGRGRTCAQPQGQPDIGLTV